MENATNKIADKNWQQLVVDRSKWKEIGDAYIEKQEESSRV